MSDDQKTAADETHESPVEATNQFFLATEGMVDPQAFFDEENIVVLIAGAAVAQA